jgi:hypothetical protein
MTAYSTSHHRPGKSGPQESALLTRSQRVRYWPSSTLSLSRQSRNQTGDRGRDSASAMRAILDDPPIHMRPDLAAARGAKQTNPVGLGHSGASMIASLVLGRYQILLTSCQESVRKGLRPADSSRKDRPVLPHTPWALRGIWLGRVETCHYCLPVKGNTRSTSPQTRASYITRIEFYHDRGVPLHLSVAALA